MANSIIREACSVIASPKDAFRNMPNIRFEKAVADYLRLLLLAGSAGSIITLLLSAGKAAYLDLLFEANVNYWNMLNYAAGKAVSLLFFCIFGGTFLLFLLSLLLVPFLRHLKYVELLRILFYSMLPIILFGWLPFNPAPLVVWCIFLFIVGIRTYKGKAIRKDSIEQRD
ncbi:TPA: hypothetical protein HA361_02790 [Candidatus Woesearchaeota archaeon]|nr:hypothetical protein [Candidatus Woesearchaeota archaeon]HII68757.1 hypothetical protein [Candidatus Woesearchaeota archaeon]